MKQFTVTAERGTGPVWVFQCREHPGAISESRRLADAESLMREVVAFVADLEPDQFTITVEVQLPEDLQRELTRTRGMLSELDSMQRETASASRELARRLVTEERLSGAEAATILGVSPQRVSQLVHSRESASRRVG